MTENYIDLEILEDGGRNIFDDIVSKMDAVEYKGGSFVKKEEIELYLLEIENILVDIDDAKHPCNEFIQKETKKLLTIWYEIWSNNIQNSAIGIAFCDNLYRLKDVLLSAQNYTTLPLIDKLFTQFETSESELKKLTDTNYAPWSMVIGAFLKDSVINGAIDPLLVDRVKPILWNSITVDASKRTIKRVEKEKGKNKTDDFWSVDIVVGGETSSADFAYFLWTFTEALESIDGVTVEITDIKKGSWIVKVKIFFRDLVAKEEVKTVLNKARNSAEAFIEKPSAEVEKLKSERNKINAEREKIEREADALPDSDEAKVLKQLQLRKMSAEIESIEINNAIKKIEGIEKLSQLVKSGFVRADDLQIDINEVLYLIKSGGSIQIGKPMDDIGDSDNVGESKNN